MKLFLVLMLCGLAAAYSDVDDSLSVEDLVKDVPRFKSYLACYLDKGPCTTQTLGYKKHFQEVFDDGCRECNDVERHMVRVFLRGLREVLPAEFQQFKAKYDSDGKHFDMTANAVQAF